MPAECHYCGRTDSLDHQWAGFWFCFWCLARAAEAGLAHWVGLRRLLDSGR